MAWPPEQKNQCWTNYKFSLAVLFVPSSGIYWALIATNVSNECIKQLGTTRVNCHIIACNIIRGLVNDILEPNTYTLEKFQLQVADKKNHIWHKLYKSKLQVIPWILSELQNELRYFFLHLQNAWYLWQALWVCEASLWNVCTPLWCRVSWYLWSDME